MNPEGSRPQTVGVVSRRLGISVRTLHHWDSMGVVSPSTRSDGDYREYSEADIARLRRALLYRELGVPLERVRALLEASLEERREELLQRRRDLTARMAQLERSLATVDRLLATTSSGVLLSAEEQPDVFGPTWDPAWAGDARAAWGDSAQWAEYSERAAARSAEDWREVVSATEAVDAELATAYRAGVKPGSPRADELAERHRAALSSYFHCTVAMHVVIGRTYSGDPSFAAHFDAQSPGLAAWLGAVIDAGARAQGIDPATATWS